MIGFVEAGHPDIPPTLLPALRASGAGDVVFVSSTAGFISYEGGASYTAAKHGVHTLAETLRLLPNRPRIGVMGMLADKYEPEDTQEAQAVS